MTKDRIKELITEIFYGSDKNKVHLPEEGTDITILEEPLIGYAAADDPLFDDYKDPSVIGEEWMSPREWMEDARTVIVFFFPYSEDVRSRAAASKKLINEAWKYGYPAGSTLSKEMTIELQNVLEKEGMKTLNPLNDSRMQTSRVPVKNGQEDDLHFIPSWSTRHGGYVAGLGTFGINRHLITEKGCCGSLTTLFTDVVLDPTERKYDDIYENCIKCGICAERCPGKAITIENLRNLRKCSEFGGYLREVYGGGGCGKCMFGVPCEHSNPKK